MSCVLSVIDLILAPMIKANFMKCAVLTIIQALIVLSLFGQSQSSNNNALCIEYTFSHLTDTVNTSKVVTGKYCLSLLGTQTSYIATSTKTTDSLMTKMMDDPSGFTSLEQSFLQNSMAQKGTTERFYADLSNKKIAYFIPWVTGKIAIYYTLPEFDWQLTDSSKDIIGVRCTKATGYWKGRHYTAWYAPSIPSSAGPWKANGLPGLILSMYDSKNHVQWHAVQLYTPNITPDVSIPPKTEVVTKEQFEKMKQDFIKDPQGTMNTVNAANAANGNNSTTTITIKGDGKLRPKPPINNPIELP
ncbi:MAG: GLPGLI family protein [Bacteroidetes bacterium]|nr:MAG: GLPGLI family protein [Bacteroidota bacterium]